MIKQKFICVKNFDKNPISLLFKGFIYNKNYLSKYHLISSLEDNNIILTIEKYRETRINKILNN